MYNFKLLKYPSGVSRLVVYEYGVREDFEEKPLKCYVPFTGTLESYKTFLSPDLDQDKIDHSFYESMRRTKSMVYDYSLSNDWDWFITLTFSPDNVNRYDYDACVNVMRLFLRHVRYKCPDARYLIVPERHKDGAFHFHGLLACADGLEMADSGVCKSGRKIYNIVGFKAGFSTATRVTDSRKSGTYLTKYITKDLCSVSKSRKRYWASRNLQLPERETLTVEFDGCREAVLDNLFDLSRYYRKSVSLDGERISYFFEFEPGIDVPMDFFR